MKQNILTFLTAVFLLMNMTGCVPLIVGGVAAGVVGAYAVSKDTIEGDTDKPYNRVWNSALTAAKIAGTIKQENKQKGCIDLVEGANSINIKVIRLTRTVVRLKVTARKHYLPNIKLAEDIFVKIIEGAA